MTDSQENTHDTARVSVIIPVYNGSAYIAKAVASVQAQNFPDLEIIVIDDGSTDDTAAVVAAITPPVRFLQQQNGGTGVARNRGVEEARGDFIAFLDADDLWAAGKLALQLAAFEKDPQLDAVWAHVREFRQGEDPVRSGQPAIAGKHPGTVLFRAPALRRCGGFATDLPNSEVVDWVSRVDAMGARQHMLPEVLMYRRLHDRNKGRNNPEAHRGYLHALKRHLDRKRS
jgi:glycosyltransferase involved in cell wall biosynthesis